MRCLRGAAALNLFGWPPPVQDHEKLIGVFGSTSELLACRRGKCFVAETRRAWTGRLYRLHIAWGRNLYDLKTEPTPRSQELSCLSLCLTSAAPGRNEHPLQ
jgi:hypothetical protein